MVIQPSKTSNLSFTTLVRGAQQFVVYAALDTTVSVFLWSLRFTPAPQIKPSKISNLTLTTLARGAQQSVVHRALDTTVSVFL